MKLGRITLAVLLCIFAAFGCSVFINPGPDTSSWGKGLKIPRPVKKEPAEVTIAAAGDVMVHSPQFRAAYVGGEKQYDFTPVFEPVQKYIAEADIALANLETTLAGKEAGYSGYPRFNSPGQMAPALKKAGFDVMVTANNHCLDRGEKGLRHTIENLESAGLSHAGTARSRQESESILVREVSGIKVAILAYTYGTNGIPLPGEKSYLVNLMDRKKMAEDIKKARHSGADLVTVYLHFGIEYQRQPGTEQRQLVDYLFKKGADVVLGSHPHVLQPAEFKTVKTGQGEQKQVFAAYSLGNFVSNQRNRYRDSGVILHITVKKEFSPVRTSVQEVKYTSTWVDKSYLGGGLSYRVVPVRDAIREFENGGSRYISRSDYDRLKDVEAETGALLHNLEEHP